MTELNLDADAARVLGSLIEKQRTTPEYYPLSLNALMNACNQKSNRDPVMLLDEADVRRSLEVLRSAGLAMQSADGGRVAKYGHNLIGKLQLALGEVAIVAELLLRGPQTAGELRARSERMYRYPDSGEFEAALDHLMAHEPPLLERLPRQPGHKESRYRHLFGSPSPGSRESAQYPESEAPAAATAALEDEVEAPSGDRVARLEREVRELRVEVARLWAELRSLTMQPE